MNLYLRFFANILKNLLFPERKGGYQSVFEETKVKLRVWPNDLDINMHMNNGRFLTLMDIGRTDFTVKTGFHKLMLKNKWGAVVTAINIAYLKPLGPFSKFELRTKLLSWDDMWFYFEQRFVKNEKIVASTIVKATFLEGRKKISPADVVSLSSGEARAPEFPEYLREMVDGEEAFISHLKKSNKGQS